MEGVVTPNHPMRPLLLLLLLCTLALSPSAWGEPPVPDADTLLKKVATRMSAAGFSAHFFQESPLKAIGIVETAEGEVWFRKPNRVRWEYKTPDRIHYITDGETLWIHSIDDAQVWTGSADAFFGKGGGARFLADVTTVAERFETGTPESVDGSYRLALTPKNPEDALERVELAIDASTFDITRVVSTAKTGEETTLVFSEFIRKVPDVSLFSFEIPEGAMVSPLE
jgi:outer membrane lipoprotein carrier protein